MNETLSVKGRNIKNNNIKSNLFIYVLLITILFGSQDTMISFHDIRIMYVNMIIALGILFYLFLVYKRGVNKHRLRIVVVMCGIVCMSMLVNLDFRGYSMFIVLSIALGFEEIFEFDTFFRAFDNLIFVISVVTLYTMLLWVKNPATGNYFYRLFYIEGYNSAIPWGFRLYGVFREPAMYCIYIGLCMARNLLYTDQRNVVKLGVYGITIFLTASMTGYIAVIFLLVGYITQKKHSRLWWCIGCVTCVCITVFVVRMGVIDYCLHRLSTTGASAESSNSRYFSIVCGMIVGCLHPLFGAGAVKSSILFDEVVRWFTDDGICWANMITYLYASYGLLYIVLFFSGLYCLLDDKEKYVSLFFVGTFCLLMCGETMTYSSIPYIFMLYGYRNKPLNRINMAMNIHSW